MKFLTKNSLAIILLIGAYLVEYLHTYIGVSVVHSTYTNAFGENITVSLSDAVYYFTHSAFTLFLIIVIFVKIDKKKLASKVIMCGIVPWFSVEVIESYCYLRNVNNDMIESSEWMAFQIFVSLFGLIAGVIGFRLFKQ